MGRGRCIAVFTVLALFVGSFDAIRGDWSLAAAAERAAGPSSPALTSATSAAALSDVAMLDSDGSPYESLVPARVLDTRAGGLTVDGTASGVGPVGAGGVLDVVVTGRGGVPAAGVGAVVLNVTAT